MQVPVFILGEMISCAVQACCWYNIFRCCGCIEDERQHVEIDKQVIVIHSTGAPKESPNPFINPKAMALYP